MTTFPRIASLSIARTSLGVVALGFALLGAWTAGDLWGQPPGQAVVFAQKKPRLEEEEEAPAKAPPKKQRVEEEEDTPKVKPPKSKVIRVEEEEDPVAKPGMTRPEAPAAGDLRQLAEQATNPGVRTLFMDLAVPHDHVVLKPLTRVTSGSGAIPRDYDVEPVPVYLGNNPTRYHKGLKFQPLVHGRREKPFSARLDSIEYVRPYEEIAQEKVRAFLKDEKYYETKPRDSKEYLSHFDMLVVAEQALSAVLRWHESAWQTGQRSGKEWNKVESGLRDQLLDDVLLKQMDVLAKSRDWNRMLALMRRLAATYTDKDKRTRISRPVAKLIKDALKDPTADEKSKQETRKRLHDLVAEFPDNPVFLDLGNDLRKEAQRLLAEARKLSGDKNDTEKQQEAERLLKEAEETWPQLQELHAYKLERSTEHPVLRVGVRGRLPKYLSPGWACTDTEQRAVEMLFESLVKLVPDEAGIFRYRPGLAEDRPKVVPLGRHFQLPRYAQWSNGKPLNSSDIRFSVGLLKTGVGLGRSRAWGELLDQVEVKGDASQVTLRLHQGCLDPLAPMTFKILPNHQARVLDTEEFAKNPVGSGPFRLDASRHSDDNRECVFFLANPSYGLRSSKRNLPHIQEVRFYSYGNAVDELRSGKLDLVLDLTAEDVDKLRQQASNVETPLPAPTAPNRRIYFLAINHSKLADVNLRKALAYAINREKLLNEHFRGPLGNKVHKVLNGPFPAGSWACDPSLANRQNKGSLDLFDAVRARGFMNQRTVGPLTLKYPEGDPSLENALKDLCEQVKSTTGIVLELSRCDPVQLRQDVERTQSYDLAYYHYDFPDETYWLRPLLGPRDGGDSNLFKFTHEKIQETLQDATHYRDFAKVREYQWAVQKLLTEQMPFIPLWQLDPLLAYSRAVKPSALEPLRVFTNIEEWRVQR
jgi:ABC-type transport system substrate-binding protein